MPPNSKFVISYQVRPDNVRRLKNPNDFGDSFYALCNVEEIANKRDLPLEKTNPREQKLTTAVAKDIASSLRRRDGKFHMLNRGITLSVAEADYDNKKEALRLVFDDEDVHGIIDGGHTYRIIRQVVSSPDEWTVCPDSADETKPQFVRLEVLTGLDRNLIIDLAETRNTSVQVDDRSLLNLAHKFIWLKEELRDWSDVIQYKMFGPEPFSVRDVIALMTLFNVEKYNEKNHPLDAYVSKARVLSTFEDNAADYEALRPVLRDILQMYDFIRYYARDQYNSEGDGGRFLRLSFVDQRRKTTLHFWKGPVGRDEKINYYIPDGVVYPVLASLRFLLKKTDSGLTWKVSDLRQFWLRFGGSLWRIAFDTCRGLGANPNAAGKNGNLWLQLHDRVKAAYVELLGVDMDRTVNTNGHQPEAMRTQGGRDA